MTAIREGTGTPTSPPRVFSPRFQHTGLVVALFFFSFSLVPSLLPRASVAQGVVTGVTVAIGYGLGVGGAALWRFLGIPRLRGRAHRIAVWVLVGLAAILAVLAGWQYVGWQNEVRALFGMPTLNPLVWPTIVIVGAIVGALCLVIGRSIRLLFRFVGRVLGRWIPPRVALVLGAIASLLLLWGLVSGVLITGAFTVANWTFSGRDLATNPGVEQPASQLRSGSPESLVAWDSLGRQGRVFVSSGPTVDQLNEFSGGGAVEPIRVYVGLRSADSLQDRAALLLEELKRTGAFDRQALIITTTTGTGWLDPNAMDPVSYLFNGDVAIAGAQYSFLPSWISLLADQQVTKDTATTVFRTIHDYWTTLPEDSRPDIYLFGLSLGSYGVEAILDTPNILNEPISGAFMAGPPFMNPLHSELTANRDPGSAPWLPVYGEGRTVRFITETDHLEEHTGAWGPTRLAYLQHGSDPVVFFSPSLMWSEPEWLREGNRAPDVSPRMRWFPVVTFWQGALDLAAGGIPEGFGHQYSVIANAHAWAGVVQPPGWTIDETARLDAFIAEQRALSD